MADDIAPTTSTTMKPAWYWVKDTSGNGSVTVTILYIAFWITSIAYMLSWFEVLTTAKFSLKFRCEEIHKRMSFWLGVIFEFVQIARSERPPLYASLCA